MTKFISKNGNNKAARRKLREKFHNYFLTNDFLDMTPKIQAKPKIEKIRLYQVKMFTHSKGNN